MKNLGHVPGECVRQLNITKKAANIVKNQCSKENYTQKYQMSSVPAVVTPVDWSKDSQKPDIYVKEEGMYEIVFSSQQSKAKDFRRHCCNVLFAHIRQHLANKIKEDHQQAITNRENQIQALEFTNEKHQQKILRLNKEIVDLVTGTYAAVDVLTTCCVSSKRIAEKFTHITLFDVSTSSLKNISDGLNFVTQTWRWLTNVMIQMPFTNGVDLSVK